MKDALDVHRALLAQDVPHEVVRLPRLVLSADEIPAAIGLPAANCVATRMYLADDRLVAILVRAGDLPHPGSVLAALGARSLRTAPANIVNERTGFPMTLVCPVLLPSDVTVLADCCIGGQDVVYTASGDGGTALGIPSRWLLTTSRASVTELCGPAPAEDYDAITAIDLRTVLDRQRDWR